MNCLLEGQLQYAVARVLPRREAGGMRAALRGKGGGEACALRGKAGGARQLQNARALWSARVEGMGTLLYACVTQRPCLCLVRVMRFAPYICLAIRAAVQDDLR